MISFKIKGVKGAKLDVPQSQSEASTNYKYLPRYIAYKAALLREKLVLSYVSVIIASLFAVYFISSRIEIFNLYEQLRRKEYILAPGVQDFTTASPQAVPDSYIESAVTDFVTSLGTINANNINQAYDGLKKFMSEELKIKFEGETSEWIEQVRSDDLAQILKIKSKQIIADGEGSYQATLFARADFYMNGQYLGNEDQVVEMVLRLVPPDRQKRWYLQIVDLSWSKLETFRNKSSYKKAQNNGGN